MTSLEQAQMFTSQLYEALEDIAIHPAKPPANLEIHNYAYSPEIVLIKLYKKIYIAWCKLVEENLDIILMLLNHGHILSRKVEGGGIHKFNNASTTQKSAYL